MEAGNIIFCPLKEKKRKNLSSFTDGLNYVHHSPQINSYLNQFFFLRHFSSCDESLPFAGISSAACGFFRIVFEVLKGTFMDGSAVFSFLS